MTFLKRNFTFVLLLGTMICVPLISNLIRDIVSYHRCVSNPTFFTPWYDDSSIKEPYTKFCLSWYPPKYRLSTNFVGDLWVVKEVKVGQVEFWTIKYKIKKEDLK
jgi:hypothetical protein